MRSTYNIGDINLNINIPFHYKEEKPFSSFLYGEKNDTNIDYTFKVIDSKLDFLEEPVYKDGDVKIYNVNGEFYREPHDVSPGSEYGYLRQCNNNSFEFNIYEGKERIFYSSHEIFKALAIEKALIMNHALMLHSSYIQWNNEAILFTAPSGTGKSTQASLWEKYEGAEIINGDKTILRKKENKWNAYGCPYAGSSNICLNKTMPIKAIVVLRQAKENKIRRLPINEAVKLILSETTINKWDKEFVSTSVDLIIDIVKSVPVYMLSCTPDKEAVDLLKETIKGD